MESQHYNNNPKLFPELKHEIIRIITKVDVQLIQYVIGNFNKKMEVCTAVSSDHLAYIISST